MVMQLLEVEGAVILDALQYLVTFSCVADHVIQFSASKLDQISSGLKEANHGIFSYYLLKGLEGKADSNQDKKITNGELLAYMDLNVSQKASELGRQQNPSLAGDPDKVLVSFR